MPGKEPRQSGSAFATDDDSRERACNGPGAEGVQQRALSRVPRYQDASATAARSAGKNPQVQTRVELKHPAEGHLSPTPILRLSLPGPICTPRKRTRDRIDRRENQIKNHIAQYQMPSPLILDAQNKRDTQRCPEKE